jgi:GH43 family beta-xylosidase
MLRPYHIAASPRRIAHRPQCRITTPHRPPPELPYHHAASPATRIAASPRCIARHPNCRITTPHRPPPTMPHHHAASPATHVALIANSETQSMHQHKKTTSRTFRLYGLVFSLFLICACGSQQQAAAPTDPSAPPQSATPAPPPTQTPVGSADDVFQNPVFRRDFPDPGVIFHEGVFYAFATNGSGQNVQAARSYDLVTWEAMPDAMPALPPWVRLGRADVWAPEVIDAAGQFVLYFTARHNESGRQCIGIATAATPDARFRSESDTPLVCQLDEGGSIDASPFRDGEQLYLYWKNDGNCCAQPTYLYVQPLAADGLRLVGEPARLVRNDAQWEGRVVEAPTMVRRDEGYFLFFSGNNYAGLEYAVGYAICETPTGPCEDAPENPILASKIDAPPLVVGPGHQDVVELAGETWLLYHAWEVLGNGTRGQRRFLWLDRLEWVDGRPELRGPTVDPQPAPEVVN